MPSPDYIVDIQSLNRDAATCDTEAASRHKAETISASLKGRPWLAIHWRCCSVYSRVYRNSTATAYEGRCPRCCKPLRVTVGEGGTDSRFFEAS